MDDALTVRAVCDHSPIDMMLTTEFSLPISLEVSVADVLQGIFEIDGMLSYADETLTIEHRPKELFSRTTRVETVHLALDSLRDVTYKKGLAGPKVVLRPRRLSAFDDVPIAAQAEIVLKVKWRDRKEAEALVAHVQRVMDMRSSPGGPSRIPFTGSDVGLREIKGHLYLEDDEFLVLDVQNALIGEFDARKHLIKVAPRALADVRVEGGRFKDRLYVRPRGRDLLEAMPGTRGDELELKIPRKYRDDLERLVYELTRIGRKATDQENRAAPADFGEED